MPPRQITSKQKLNVDATITLNGSTFDGKLIETGRMYYDKHDWFHQSYWIFVSNDPIPFERDRDLELEATSFANPVFGGDRTGQMFFKPAVVKKIVLRKRVLITQYGGWDV